MGKGNEIKPIPSREVRPASASYTRPELRNLYNYHSRPSDKQGPGGAGGRSDDRLRESTGGVTGSTTEERDLFQQLKTHKLETIYEEGSPESLEQLLAKVEIKPILPLEKEPSAVNASHNEALKRNLFYNLPLTPDRQSQVDSGGPLGKQREGSGSSEDTLHNQGEHSPIEQKGVEDPMSDYRSDPKFIEVFFSSSTKKEFTKNLYEYFQNKTESQGETIDKQDPNWNYFQKKPESPDKTTGKQDNITEYLVTIIGDQVYTGEIIDEQDNKIVSPEKIIDEQNKKTVFSSETIDKQNNITKSTSEMISEQGNITISPSEMVSEQGNITKLSGEMINEEDLIAKLSGETIAVQDNTTISLGEGANWNMAGGIKKLREIWTENLSEELKRQLLVEDQQIPFALQTTLDGEYEYHMNGTEFSGETIHKQDNSWDYFLKKTELSGKTVGEQDNVVADAIEKQREIWTIDLPEPLTRQIPLQVAFNRADELLSWTPEVSVEAKIESWQKEHPKAPTRDVDSADDWGDTFQRFIIELAEHQADLYQIKEDIDFKAGKLASEPPLVYDPDKAELLKQVAPRITKINEAIGETRETLQMVMEYYPKLVELKPEHHRFFEEQDKLTPHREQPTIEFLPRQSYPAGNLARTLRAYFQAHNTDGERIIASEKRIAEALEADPLGGNIEVTKLDRYDTTLSDLGDTKGLEFWQIRPQDIDSALRYGPIIAFLDTSQATVPSEGYYPERAVLVSHIEKEGGDVHDNGKAILSSEQLTNSQKKELEQLEQAGLHHLMRLYPDGGRQVAVFDEQEGYHKISLPKFAEKWKGGVLLPRKARAALEFIT